MILLQQMIIMFLLMATGFMLRKMNIMNDIGSKTVSGIVVYLANPALMLSAGINKETSIEGMAFVKILFLACMLFAVLVLLGKIIPIVIRAPKHERGTYEIMTVFSNIGFMGFPLLSAMYGSESLLYASLFQIPYNVLIYTYAVRIMERISGKEVKTNKGIPWKNIFNVGVIACILMVILYLTKLPVPIYIETTVNHLSNLTAPLSMIVIGDSMACTDMKKLFTNGRLLAFSFFKLLVIPLVGIPIFRLFGINTLLLGVLMVMLSTPVGAMTAMMAGQYDAGYELDTNGVALTSLLSVVTMPIVALVLGL